MQRSSDFDSAGRERRPGPAAPLLILFCLALGLRLIRLFDLDLNFDEVVLLFRSQDSWVDIWNNCKTDNYAPLYPWLIKFWMLFGSGDQWYRLFGALAGSLTPPAAYLLGREIGGRKMAWLVGAATVLSPSLIFYSQFVRMFNVQTALVCLSLAAFFRALRTDSTGSWLLVMVFNLIGFFVYYFMLLLVLAEFLILIYDRRRRWKTYIRPLSAQIPFVVGVLFWLIPAYQRYSQIASAGFWIVPPNFRESVKVWLVLGTGADFRDRYLLAGLANLPFLAGVIAAIALPPRDRQVSRTAFVTLFILGIIGLQSAFGTSFWHSRYVLFLLPLYLLLALSGWLRLGNPLWRRAGISIIFLILVCSLAYYYVDYYKVHEYYAFLRPLPAAEPGEGHALSITDREIAERFQGDEVIIHFSDGVVRVCSYFASLHYHQRQLPEYIYAHEGLSQYNGLQYLRPGEWIASLKDLPSLPGGIWLVTLSFSEGLLSDYPPRWVRDGNLPEEMRSAGYRRLETFQRGNVTVNHFRRLEITTDQKPNIRQ